MEVKLNENLGMKWFKFFIYVRPWIAFIFSFSYIMQCLEYVANPMEYGDFSSFNIVFLVAYIFYVILQAAIVILVDEKLEYLLNAVRAVIVLEVFINIYTYTLQYYLNWGTFEGVFLSIVIMLIFEYLVWYRLNVKYFRRRLEPVMGTENKTEQTYSLSSDQEEHKAYGNFNIYGSDIVLKKDDAKEERRTRTDVNKQNQSSNDYQLLYTECVAEKSRFCSQCGGKIDNETKRCVGCGKQYFKGIRLNTVASIFVIVLLLFSCILNIALGAKVKQLDSSDEIKFLQNENANLENKISSLTNEISSLKSELEICYMEIDFIDEYVVFVEDDGTNLYHKYQCYKFRGESFWAFNEAAAIGQGYEPCSLCDE